MLTSPVFTNPSDRAGLQNLHRLATVRYNSVINGLYALKREDEQAEYQRSCLRRQEEHQHGFILELNRLLYEAGVDLLT